jgi:hypothetical protein
MKAILSNRPLPVCILRRDDPARANENVDLAETFARNTPPMQAYRAIGDDYDQVQQDDWMSAPGGFK